ncbi:LysE family translocator [Vibrio sonorensis]|uniref:LysE family translocator n=1 Tax=Vibrio sonorensis TaxID=1004316 RepID=UPI0008DA4516|nr:LysE family translocator [Vibrio sonorensis]
MEFSQFWALALFAFVTTFTPGPNNIMLMASGANVGFKKTIPHMAGITIGFSVMVLLVGIGLMGVFNTYPVSHAILKYLSLVYLAYLAFKIATSKPVETDCSYRPMTFFAAASFQWVNPKGWSMALTAVTVYSANGAWYELSLIAFVFALVNLPSVTFWAAAGQQLQRWLTTPTKIRGFNGLMAALLIASTLPMI